jgi:GT2 family glycosyltransferase
VRAGAAACAGHRAVLGYAVGNEIPASIVRWAGRRRIERHIRRLHAIAKSEDPGAIVTYGNYPSTEYLDLPFLDFVCFNVYLEQPARLRRYIARLQNLAGDRPLVLGEIGLDSRRNGARAQAMSLRLQLRTAFSTGCAGAFVFAWTDEWHRGGHDVDDWDFGITRRDRIPKPALPAVRDAFANAPFARDTAWPRVTVVVCVYNGEHTLEDCLAGLDAVDYPDYEVIVVDDGSTDRSAQVAASHDCLLIRTENRGLSAARNTGLGHATGKIIAYIDADARPDPHWLYYLAETLRDSDYVGVGGPNLPCTDDGEVAECVANAPGGPVHVLLSDSEAEHLPGCNMAFLDWALEAVGGFDEQFRVAGDDVDLCWRLQEGGWKLGFSPSAVAWHHQRDSIRGYCKQQLGYGRAEALLEAKWPEKYNTAGQINWGGRIYGRPLLYALTLTSRVYHGTWGTAPFQPRHLQPGKIAGLAATPEWNLVLAALLGASLLGLVWSPLLLALPLLALAGGISLWRAGRGAATASFSQPAPNRRAAFRRRARTALLFLLQPAARLYGRLSSGLTPWRGRRVARLHWPWRRISIWSNHPRGVNERLGTLEGSLKRERVVVVRGGPYDRWDLAVREGASGVARLRMCIEDHGHGEQVVHFRVWPWPDALGLNGLLICVPTILASAAAWDRAWPAAAVLGGIAAAFSVRLSRQCTAAAGLLAKQVLAAGRQDLLLGDSGLRASHAPPLGPETPARQP